jgi:undecaprenyl-diphosphatase
VRPWLSIAAVGVACLVAASRALLGVHWLTDVVAGLAVGWTWFFVVAVIFGGRLQRFGEPTERLATTPVDASTHMNGARHGI